jgi:flagellar basal body-associated protein FliL
MSAAPAAPEAAAPAAKKGGKLVILIVCVICVVAGAALPMVVDLSGVVGGKKADKKEKGEPKTVVVPFSEVVVNLSEERMSRYLRVKIAVLVDAEHEAEMTEALTKHKAAVKSKIISHIAGKTLKDVSGTSGVTRMQRELLERFEDVLSPDGEGHVRGVLFEEYVVQ